MIRVYRERSDAEQEQKAFEPRLSKKGQTTQPVKATTDSLDIFTADDIMTLMTNVAELKDLFVQAINCGNGKWEFVVGDNTYQLNTCPV